MSRSVRQRLAGALDRRFEALHHRVEALDHAVAALARSVDGIAARLDEDLVPALRIMAGRDSETRRLVADARADPEYHLAFEERDPLVSVILPTFGRAELLRSRALPAALAQTHERIEVLVIADGPNADAETATRETADARVRWTTLPQRYVYPDPHRHWLAASTLARNEGYRLARGRWLFDFDDDDSLPPDAIERLLAAARERRAEAVQGVISRHAPDGGLTEIHGVLPSELPLKGALVHSHLRFFEREHVASAFGIPGDWFRGERMLRAGVRIELVDAVTYDYYPSSLWQPR